MDPIYNEYYVTGILTNFVKKLWILDNLSSRSPILQKGVPPNGCFTMAIVQGNGLHIRHKDQARHLPEGIYFCGQITKTLSLDILSSTKAAMIQLFPWTPACFGVSDAHLFTDKICSASELTYFKELNLDIMIGLNNEMVCNHLVKIFSPSFTTNAKVQIITKSTQLILGKRSDITVASLAKSMKCSERHLQKLFKNFIGISPKLFINIIQLREALDDVVYPNDKLTTVIQVALSNGYYDQPHFNNTFASFIGTTPKNFKEKEFYLTIKK
ncbi:helix-turn-helix transcriptional regulator [Epilithonimonas mollis]|uniref:Helix-turn-helix domain-containing protein n=1 Tax=Epilithonimonas mollis TaxID=216903 RepID=A0A1M6UPT2_9FLAO|nr:helix-turn-helix transcriptional regulator [Epilithonimonas mollis]SHK71217.1 Helix-turn-helix domain-containing protein [Epilithonimonas mollis]